MQRNDPMRGDFHDLVIKDLQVIDLKITENQIAQMTKEKLKSIVKKNVREAGLFT